MSIELKAIVNSQTLNSETILIYNNKNELFSQLHYGEDLNDFYYPWIYKTGHKREQRLLRNFSDQTQKGRAIISNILKGNMKEALQLIFSDIDDFYHTCLLQIKISQIDISLISELATITKTGRIKNFMKTYENTSTLENLEKKTKSYLYASYPKPENFLQKYKLFGTTKNIPYLNYDNNDLQDNKCFYNFLQERYNKLGKKQKNKFNHIEGVSIQDIIDFTNEKKIKCKLYNIVGRCIYYNDFERNKNHPNLQAIISNHHIYPLTKDRKTMKPELNKKLIYTENEELFDTENSEICNDIAYVKNDKTYTRDGCLLPYGLDKEQIDNVFFQGLHANFSHTDDITHIKSFYYTNNKKLSHCSFEYDINSAFFYVANEFIINSHFDKCPIFTYDDIWQKYENKNIDVSSYYTISEKALKKLKKYGLNDNQRIGFIIKLLLDENLLNIDDIEYVKKPSFLVPWSEFKKNLNKLIKNQISVKLNKDVKELKDEDIEACNIKKDYVLYNGLLGKVRNENNEYIYGCDKDEYDLLNYDLSNELWEMIEIPDVDTVYYKKHNKIMFKNLNNITLYNHIVEATNYILLENIINIKKQFNIKPIKINTDSISYDGEIDILDKYINIFKLQTIETDIINKQNLPVKHKEIFKMIRHNEVNYNNIEDILKTINERVSKVGKDNITFTGAPGTGKTYTVKNNYTYDISCTSTNMCLLNMDEDSKTIFSLLELHHQDHYLKVLKKLSNRTIWVDEFSMIDTYVLNFFFVACYLYNTKIIWSGDINQIAPINGDKVNLESTMNKLLFGNITYLTKDYRNEKSLIKLREQVLDNNFINIHKLTKKNNQWQQIKHHIVFYHKTKEYINIQMLKLNNYKYKICYDKNGLFTHKNISNGVVLIVRQNNKKLNFLKNDRWEVVNNDEETGEYVLQNIITEKFMRVTYENTKWFTLGFAFTSHSSQGLTIKDKYAIHDVKAMLYTDKDIFYTALTRGQQLKDISFYNTYRPLNFIYDIKEPKITTDEQEYLKNTLIKNKN